MNENDPHETRVPLAHEFPDTVVRRKGKWADLSRRLVSTAVLLAVALALGLSSGFWLRIVMGILTGITFWELARMTGWRHHDLHDTPFGSRRPPVLGALAALSLIISLSWMSVLGPLVLAVPVVLGMLGASKRDRVTYAVYGSAILLAGYSIVIFREAYGIGFIVWFMGVVVISDTLGYFAGRLIGGPKFWAALSPKKTWSGTVAGWIGAAVFGGILAISGMASWNLILLSPLVAFAGQMGDIAESWLKRRAGVKDSSNLIPGHGGFMDRFDAICGATLAVLLLTAIVPGFPAIG